MGLTSSRFDELGLSLVPLTKQSGWRGGSVRIRWYYDTLTPGLNKYPIHVRAAIAAVAEEFADYAQAYMRENAPWEDQTGDARAGLTAEAEHDLFTTNLHLYHKVDYGVWLETRWSGRYAIVVPTMEKIGPEFMAALELIERYMG